MRRFPPWIWLMLTVVFAAASGLAWLKSRPLPPAPAETRAAPVVVAKQDLGPALALSPEQLKVVPWRRESVPQGSFANPRSLEGRVTLYPLGEGEPVLEKKLAPRGTMPGLTALLPPQKRAMTVKVDEASGVAGFVSPNNRVDVVVTLDKGDFGKDPVSKLVFQNLKVLGIGQRIESRPGDKPQVVPTVTLEVSPEEGEGLALAAHEGRISLILRGQDDRQAVATPGADTSHLLGVKAQPQETAPAPRPVEIIRGLARSAGLDPGNK